MSEPAESQNNTKSQITSSFSGQHIREEFVGGPHDGICIDGHNFGDGVGRDLIDRFADDNSGVVDENVDDTDFLANTFSGRGDLSRIGKIDGIRGSGTAGGNDSRSRRLISG